MNDLIVTENREISTQSAEDMRLFVENMQQQMEMMAITVQSMSAKIDELNRQLRWAVPMSPPQVKKVNEVIRKRATELLKKYGHNDAGMVKELSGIIRKNVKCLYGAGSIREIPKSEFANVCRAAEKWFDIYAYQKVVEHGETSSS